MAIAEIVALVGEIIGKRTAILTTTEFAQITGRHPETIRADCLLGKIKTLPREAFQHYRIPVKELAPYLS